MEKDQEILALAKELEQLAKEERFEELEKKMPSLDHLSSFMQSMFSQHTDSDAAKFREYDRQVVQRQVLQQSIDDKS